MKLDIRIFFSVIGSLFFRRLIWPIALFVISVSLLDPNINWTALREHLSTLDPWKVTLFFTTLILSWSLIAGRALRPVWSKPTVAFLVRQPISSWYWVRNLLPSLSIAFLPVIAIWWLAPHHVNPVAHYLGFVGLAWTIILGASFHGFTSVKLIAIGTAVLTALIYGYAIQPGIAYLALFVTILLLPLGITGIQEQLTRSKRVHPGHLSSAWPIATLVRRDLLCLWRVERKSLFSLVLPAVIAALMMLALRVNGQVTGHQAFTFACGLLAFAMMPTFEMLSRLKTTLGTELMRQRWPINHVDRGIALLCMMVVLTGPIIIALAVLGSTMGFVYGLLFLLFATTSIVTLIALFSRNLVATAPMLGWGLWLLFIHVLLVVLLPPWAYAAVAVAMVLVARSMILTGLRMFTYQTELGNLDQFA